jgi:ParB family chromosome partitioning protein
MSQPPRLSAPRLGRGLAALLGETMQTPRTGEPSIRSLPIEMLVPGPFQPRGPVDPASLAELAESIRTRGILQPILVRPDPTQPDMHQIIAGERRWRAAQTAGLHEIPCLVRPLADNEAMAAALVENLQRQDLNAIEEAEGYRRLTEEFSLTQDSLAQAVGKSRSHIANTMRLLNLAPVIQTEVKTGALSAGHARALLAHPQPEKAYLAVIARGLNVRQTEALAAREAHAPDAARRSETNDDPETRALEHDLSTRLGMRVTLQFDGRKGVLHIAYRSLDQLDQLIALLNPR